MSKLKYGVVGVGAAGGVFGGMLLKAGCDVAFLARGDFRQLQQHGLELIDTAEAKAEAVFDDLTVHRDMSFLAECEVVLLCVKSYDNEAIIPELKRVVRPGTVIMIMQNGLATEKTLAPELADSLLVPTVSWVKATKVAAGRYRHDFGDKIDAAVYSQAAADKAKLPSEIEQQLTTDFQSAGLNLNFSQQFSNQQWTKLVLNLPITLLTINNNCTSNEVLNNKELARELDTLQTELIAVAKVCGAEIDAALLAQICDKLKTAQQPTSPSMKLDFDRGARLETGSTFDQVLQAAQTHALEMPNFLAAYDNLKIKIQEKTHAAQTGSSPAAKR